MNSNPNIDIAILVKNHLAAKKWDMHAQPEVVESAVQAVFEKVPDLIEEIVDHDFMAQACFGHSKKRRTRPKEQTAEAPSATSGSPTATRPSALSARPRVADEAYFTGKILKTLTGDIEVTKEMAKAIYKYLLKNDFTDAQDKITEAYHEAAKAGSLPALPPELAPHAEQVFQLINTVFSEAQLPGIEDDRQTKSNSLNSNFEKKEFQALWNRINRKAVYTVHFDTNELVKKCVHVLEKELKVASLQYTIQRGEQKDTGNFDDLKKGEAFKLEEHETKALGVSVQSTVKYDLIGKLAEDTKLTRNTIARILSEINLAVFNQYKVNPEDFMIQSARLINEQKATADINFDNTAGNLSGFIVFKVGTLPELAATSKAV